MISTGAEGRIEDVMAEDDNWIARVPFGPWARRTPHLSFASLFLPPSLLLPPSYSRLITHFLCAAVAIRHHRQSCNPHSLRAEIDVRLRGGYRCVYLLYLRIWTDIYAIRHASGSFTTHEYNSRTASSSPRTHQAPHPVHRRDRLLCSQPALRPRTYIPSSSPFCPASINLPSSIPFPLPIFSHYPHPSL